MEPSDLSHKYDYIYFIGDSFTFAMNQRDDVHQVITESNRFSGLVSSHFNIPEINAGMPGCGNQYIFRKVYEDIHKLINEGKKLLVVLSYTWIDRIEFFHRKQNRPLPISAENFSFYKSYVIESMDYHYNKQISCELIWTMHTLFEKYNIDYIETYMDTIIDVPYANTDRVIDTPLMEMLDPIVDRFTPVGHANVTGNAKIASQYIKKITELYGTN